MHPSETPSSPLAAEVEILRHRLEAVAEQMGETLARTAFSANIKERRDHSCAVFDGRGELLAQAAHIPVHLGSMPASVEAALACMAFGPGDVVLLNDPYAGGSHLPDLTMITPICGGERIVGYAANRAHHADVGGRTPGSMGVTTHIDEEGVRIAPTKWYAAGREDVAFRERFLSAVRVPRERLGDLRAQLAANEVGRRGLLGLVEGYGASRFLRLAEELRRYTARRMRQALAALPPGEYAAEEWLDGDGIEARPIRIAVRVRLDGGEAIVDFSGTDRQVPGCVNCPLAVTRSATVYVFACLADEALPHNAGMFEPIRVSAPRGCVVNAEHPAAVAAGNVETSQRIVDVLLRALAGAAPERIPAGASGTMASLSLGGTDPANGTEFTYYETIAGGMGAWAEGAGESAVHTHMTNTLNTPIEAIEGQFPLRVVRYEIRRDSGGSGQHRGGDGIVRAIEALAPVSATLLADRERHGGLGLAGGSDGAGLSVHLRRCDGRMERMGSKFSVDLAAGEQLIVETPGGGGWGTE